MNVEEFYKAIKGVNDKIVVLIDEESEKEYPFSPGKKYTIGDKLVIQNIEEFAFVQDFALAIERLASEIRFKPDDILGKNKLLPYNVCFVINEREFNVTNVDTRADVVRVYGKWNLMSDDIVKLALEQNVRTQATTLKSINIVGLYGFECIANMYLTLNESEKEIINTVFTELYGYDFVEVSKMVILDGRGEA